MSNKTPMTFDQAASFGVVGMVAHQPAMSTTKGEYPQPSDAAMAAAERIKLNYLITLDHPDLYPVPTEQLAAIIDRHFAPLRASNDKLRAALKGTYSLALAWANYYAMQYDCKGGAHPRHRAILDEAKAALAPERKETT